MSRFSIESLKDCSALARVAQAGVRQEDMLAGDRPWGSRVPIGAARQQQRTFDTLIALGAVIRGETYHFELVANESAAGVAATQLQTGVPVANGILTTDDDDQALARMSVKGAEVARVALEMANLLKQLDEQR
jgi:6,7-dimethyl-8-ribityllumazine synthase